MINKLIGFEFVQFSFTSTIKQIGVLSKQKQQKRITGIINQYFVFYLANLENKNCYINFLRNQYYTAHRRIFLEQDRVK